MKEAFGGVFMIRLLLVFIVVYVSFSAVSLNYAKAFRVKNKVIDFIEQNQIYDLNNFFSAGSDKQKDKLSAILSNATYNKECINGNGPIVNGEGITEGYCYDGIIIRKVSETNNSSVKKIRYEVKTYADWNLGILNLVLELGGRNRNSEPIVQGTWEIKGDAIVVARN